MSSFDKLLVLNRDVLARLPIVRGAAAGYLLGRRPLRLADLPEQTRYACSYALTSEKRLPSFEQVMDHMSGYIGAGYYGPNKYWEYPWVLTNLDLKPGLKVLDAGCGTSPPQYTFARLGCDVEGVDPNEGVEWHGIDRNLAKRFGVTNQYRVESMEKMSFDDNTFDRVACISVIEHCRETPAEDEFRSPQTDDDRALQLRMMREMVRVLKPGGRLVLTTDVWIARDNCPAEALIDVANLLSVEGVRALEPRCDEPLPGEDGFDPHRLIQNGDIDIVCHGDLLQTSVGITLQKVAG